MGQTPEVRLGRTGAGCGWMREGLVPVSVNLLGNVLLDMLSWFVCGLMQRIACPLDALPSGVCMGPGR
eukprot:1157923-Pelagomonas_calceolata.AAC.2